MGIVHLETGNAALREGVSLQQWWEADCLSLMVLEGHLLGSSAGTGTVQPSPVPGSPHPHWPCEVPVLGRAEGNGYIIDGNRAQQFQLGAESRIKLAQTLSDSGQYMCQNC